VKLKRLLLQKHVTYVELEVLYACVVVRVGTPLQLTEFTLMKMLHSETSVEQIAMNATMMMKANRILVNLLHAPTSRLYQLIS